MTEKTEKIGNRWQVNGKSISSYELYEDVVEMHDNRDADNDTALKEATAIIYKGIELLHEVDKLREWAGVRAWLEKWGRD